MENRNDRGASHHEIVPVGIVVRAVVLESPDVVFGKAFPQDYGLEPVQIVEKACKQDQQADYEQGHRPVAYQSRH